MHSASELTGQAHPGGKWTSTANVPAWPSTGIMGTVSTHRVKLPQRCTCEGVAGESSSSQMQVTLLPIRLGRCTLAGHMQQDAGER